LTLHFISKKNKAFIGFFIVGLSAPSQLQAYKLFYLMAVF